MSNTEKDQQAIDAVTQYAYDRHARLNRSNVIGWDEEELERVAVDKDGYLIFTVGHVVIEEQECASNSPVWYVMAQIFFQVTDGGEEIEGSEDVYEAYQDNNGKWCIQ